jgi:hypothetical protein
MVNKTSQNIVVESKGLPTNQHESESLPYE